MKTHKSREHNRKNSSKEPRAIVPAAPNTDEWRDAFLLLKAQNQYLVEEVSLLRVQNTEILRILNGLDTKGYAPISESVVDVIPPTISSKADRQDANTRNVNSASAKELNTVASFSSGFGSVVTPE